MPELAFVNGLFLPVEQAVVPVEDRGFQFADAVYEVMATYGGIPFEMDRHLERLQRSLDALGIGYDVVGQGVARSIASGIERAGFPETLVYIQISRGVAPRRHEFFSGIAPTVVMTFKEPEAGRKPLENRRPHHHFGGSALETVRYQKRVPAAQRPGKAGGRGRRRL